MTSDFQVPVYFLYLKGFKSYQPSKIRLYGGFADVKCIFSKCIYFVIPSVLIDVTKKFQLSLRLEAMIPQICLFIRYVLSIQARQTLKVLLCQLSYGCKYSKRHVLCIYSCMCRTYVDSSISIHKRLSTYDILLRGLYFLSANTQSILDQ